MIRESEHFFFNGRKSTDFGIINVSIGTGAYEELIASGKTISETYPRYAFKPYFHGVQKEPKEFELTFYFTETWNDRLIDEVLMWLNTDEYHKLYFSADIDRVFYAMQTNGISLIHNGLKDGYVTLTMRCDSAYSYGHRITTPVYNMVKKPNQIIELKNYGHYKVNPDIWIKKISQGDITISNLSNKNISTIFTDIEMDEVLSVNGQTEIIKSTNKEKEHRYDDFNDIYLELVYGINRLKISNNVEIKFNYQYIFS